MKQLKVKITFFEETLGLTSSNPDLLDEFIASKAPDAISRKEEIAAIGVDAVVEKGTTVFPKLEDGTPFAWDYQWKGFFKDACGMLRRVDDMLSSKITAYKKNIDGLIIVLDRKIPYENYGEIGICTRQLRASTPQGERIGIARSETLPAGTTCTFTILCLRDNDVALVEEWLNYGRYKGFSQWSNSGKGRFTYEILEENDVENTITPPTSGEAKKKRGRKKSDE